MTQDHPVVVIGAGPIGLAAAAELVDRGLDPIVLEAGPRPAAAVRDWSHVRLFSTWSELVSPAAARLLEPTGWRRPEGSRYPLGGDWASEYLDPLAAVLGDRIRLDTRVIGVAKRGRDKVVDSGRESQPFTVHALDATGSEVRITARAVIDASGTWATPNPLGGDGYPAAGEQAASDRISYRIPDLRLPDVRARYAGKQVAVVGAGHSALTALVELVAIAESGTHVTWVLRRGEIGDAFGGGEADQLPARSALGRRAEAAVRQGHVDVVTGFRTQEIDKGADERLVLVGEDGRRLPEVAEIIGLTGFRPDLSFLSEVRLELDVRLQAPVELAPLIDPNIHSCGTVYPHGVNELSHPEKGLYLVGMKSYGRAPTFLAMTGYEQVRSVVAAIAGDRDAAERVELTLPDSGVCGGAGLFDEADATQEAGGCCGPAEPAVVQIGGTLPT
ncbi:MAG TPA: NAD(P)-binding domain-containing protein [Jiangellaceae bacterium]